MHRNRKQKYNQFSDDEIAEEIHDQVQEIRDKHLLHIEEAEQIAELYRSKKEEKRKRKRLEQDNHKKSSQSFVQPRKQAGHSSDEDEEGEIRDNLKERDEQQHQISEVPSINNLGDHIRPITLTRSKVCQLLNSMRFQQLVKGCFVRYRSDSSSNGYMIAQIVGITQSPKQYQVETYSGRTIITKVTLKLQETSETVGALTLKMISNQHPPPGILEVEKWLQTNRNKIPQQSALRAKLEQLNKLITQHLSSEQIDENIMKKAIKVATSTEGLEEDIYHLINFLDDKIHNYEQNIEDCKNGRVDDKFIIDKKKRVVKAEEKVDIQQLERKKNEAVKYHRMLVQKQKMYQESKKAANEGKDKPKDKEVKKYSWSLMSEYKEDLINQKYKTRLALLTTNDGYAQVKDTIVNVHKACEFEFEC